MRILVVDDVGYVRHYLDRMLTQHGHSVSTAASGAVAVEMLKEEHAIQVVVTDLIMPGMNGIDLFKQAHKIDRVGERGALPPPIFYLITALRPGSTPDRDSSMLQQALDLGFADVLFKPIDNERLLRLLANLDEKLPPGLETAKGHETTKGHDSADYAGLLQAVARNVDQLAECADRRVLTQLVECLHGGLARAARLIDDLDASPRARPAALGRPPADAAVIAANL